MKEKITEALSDTAINTLEKRLTSYSGEKELIKSFKEILTKISESDNEENKKPLIIIVDELDRCKPSYAVALIEKVKHIFSTKNVFFILVMHKEQLIEALKCVYGQGLDASTYLQKFIHIETTLPKKQAASNINYSDITKYCDHLYKGHALNQYQLLNQSRGLDDIKIIANHLNLSLRQMEKIFILLTLYLGSFPNDAYMGDFQRKPTPSSLIVLLTVIKVTEPILYADLANNNANYTDIYKKYRFSEMEKNNSTFYIQKIIYFLLLSNTEFSGLVTDNMNSNESGIHQWAAGLGADRKNIIPSIISKLNTFTPSV
ncbi:MAG: KAP family NTPase [Emcibacter sp.]|nr:KAP family NTPase [Emcibacter sp.]